MKIDIHSFEKGVSEKDFRKVHEDIKLCCIDEGLTNLNNIGDIENLLKDSTDDDKKFVESLKNQVAESTNVINANFKEYEDLINRIFTDWEAYLKKESKGE